MVDPSRRRLFTVHASAVTKLRAPWSVPEAAFTDHCSRCGKCVDACETGVLIKGTAGFPEIDFQRAECSFCGQCANVCPEPVFTSTTFTPWHLTVTFQPHCLTYQSVACQSCKDFCDVGAISFIPQAGGIATPQLATTQCTGCGACVATCPVNAITINPQD